MDPKNSLQLNRRDLLKWGGAVLFASAADLRPAEGSQLTLSGCSSAPEHPEINVCSGGVIEELPTSPFILEPFQEPLVIPTPLKAVTAAELATWTHKPGYGCGQQSSDADARSTHQLRPADLGLPEPIIYHIKLQVGYHQFTKSKVQSIDRDGRPVAPPFDTTTDPRYLPPSLIWGFNGKFPGPMIYARYRHPVLVRFENCLGAHSTLGGETAEFGFGSPERGFLTHLHNGHTAPESDGNPHFEPHGYAPGAWVDNLYLNWPPDNDDNEMQSFLWFHDHFEGHTGAQVYKGLVGLYPIYDSKLDPGNENDQTNPNNLRLPGVPRGRRAAGEPDPDTGVVDLIDYDIPLVFFDCAFNDGVTRYKDFHNGCGETHPEKEWWGQLFFRHFPNHGFVGDVFTVNGTAFPVLYVKRRKYRFRFLDASIARVYEFKLMKSSAGPQAAPGTQGQWLIPDGQQCMQFTQIASEGGLLPHPIIRDSFELWPSRRKEIIVDFTSRTKGEEIYLVNVAKMEDGRKPDNTDPSYKVPVLKIIVGDPPPEPDRSEDVFVHDVSGKLVPKKLRDLPQVDFSEEALNKLEHHEFVLRRGFDTEGITDPKFREVAEEFEWTISVDEGDEFPFDLCQPLIRPAKSGPQVWRIKNGGGGWVHPMHFHQEEHRIIEKNGVKFRKVTPVGSDDVFAKEDTISLAPGEEVVIYRNFRTFPTERAVDIGLNTAKYVAHCHNLAHEDHSMMFGWEIVRKFDT